MTDTDNSPRLSDKQTSITEGQAPMIGSMPYTPEQVRSLVKDIDESKRKVWRHEGLVISDSQELSTLTNFLRSVPGFGQNHNIKDMSVYEVGDEITIRIMGEHGQNNLIVKINGGEHPSIVEDYQHTALQDRHLYQIGKHVLTTLKNHERAEKPQDLTTTLTSLIENHPNVENTRLGVETTTPINRVVMNSDETSSKPFIDRLQRELRESDLIGALDTLDQVQFIQYLNNLSEYVVEIDFYLNLDGVQVKDKPNIGLQIEREDGFVSLSSNLRRVEREITNDHRNKIRVGKMFDRVNAISGSALSGAKLGILTVTNRVLSGEVR